MKVDNPVSNEFLLHHPVEAARVLERLSAKDVAALFSELSPKATEPILVAMLPNTAATCLEWMEALSVVKLLTEIPVAQAAHIYRNFPPSKQKELFNHLSDKTRRRISRFLDYAPLSAGDLMNQAVTMLPEGLTVADAMRRVERIQPSVSSEIYITDNAHHLMGVIDLGSLLTASKHASLRDIMIKKTQSVSVHASLEKLLLHPGWATYYRLPVVERDNTLVGVLDYMRLQEATGERSLSSHDHLNNMLSLAGLYWLSLSELLESFLNISRDSKGER